MHKECAEQAARICDDFIARYPSDDYRDRICAGVVLRVRDAICAAANTHNHGPEDGPGVACGETVVNGRLKGECMNTPAPVVARRRPTIAELEELLNSEDDTPIEILSDGSIRRIDPAVPGMPEEPEVGLCWEDGNGVLHPAVRKSDYDALRAYAQQQADRIRELEFHEPDLIFHDGMHELGAKDGETWYDLCYRVSEERKQQAAEIERLTRERDGWEADALNYARSRECQQEMTERERARAEKAERELAERPGYVLVPVETLKRWKDTVSHYWFRSDGEEQYNNDDIIETDNEISALLAAAKGEA